MSGFDPVARPKHYNSHGSGVETIELTEHLSFSLGNALKYVWRAGDKGNEKQDLEKALWYLERELTRPVWIVRGFGKLRSLIVKVILGSKRHSALAKFMDAMESAPWLFFTRLEYRGMVRELAHAVKQEIARIPAENISGAVGDYLKSPFRTRRE